VILGGPAYGASSPCSTPFTGQGRRYASPAVYASAGDPIRFSTYTIARSVLAKQCSRAKRLSTALCVSTGRRRYTLWKTPTNSIGRSRHAQAPLHRARSEPPRAQTTTCPFPSASSYRGPTLTRPRALPGTQTAMARSVRPKASCAVSFPNCSTRLTAPDPSSSTRPLPHHLCRLQRPAGELIATVSGTFANWGTDNQTAQNGQPATSLNALRAKRRFE
jgi:hypothetical protein